MACGFAGVGFHFLGLVVIPKDSVVIGVVVFACNGYGNCQCFGWIVRINVVELVLKMKCVT